MAESRKGVSWEADTVIQARNGNGLDSMVVVGGEKWTERDDGKDMGRKGESQG